MALLGKLTLVFLLGWGQRLNAVVAGLDLGCNSHSLWDLEKVPCLLCVPESPLKMMQFWEMLSSPSSCRSLPSSISSKVAFLQCRMPTGPCSQLSCLPII